MKNDILLLNVFKDKGLITGLFISLLVHIFLLFLFQVKKDKLLGDKYIPIEIINIDTTIVKGDSIEKTKQINKKINPVQKLKINEKKTKFIERKS